MEVAKVIAVVRIQIERVFYRADSMLGSAVLYVGLYCSNSEGCK